MQQSQHPESAFRRWIRWTEMPSNQAQPSARPSGTSEEHPTAASAPGPGHAQQPCGPHLPQVAASMASAAAFAAAQAVDRGPEQDVGAGTAGDEAEVRCGASLEDMMLILPQKISTNWFQDLIPALPKSISGFLFLADRPSFMLGTLHTSSFGGVTMTPRRCRSGHCRTLSIVGSSSSSSSRNKSMSSSSRTWLYQVCSFICDLVHLQCLYAPDAGFYINKSLGCRLQVSEWCCA